MVPTTPRSTPPSAAPANPTTTARARTPSPTSLVGRLREIRTRQDARPRLAALAGDVARRLTGRARPQGGAKGQAYCGRAHGRWWDVDPESPPAAVTVRCPDAEEVCYRLARDPRTQRPARDPRGRYVYVPVRFDPDSARHRAG